MTTEKRSQVLDIVKGLAIIAIVAGHVWRGLENAGLIDQYQALFPLVDRSLYMFHLSVFAFTAGLFVQRGMQRDGAWTYAWKRDLNFIWLYLLWSTIQVGVKLAATGLVNQPVELWDLFSFWLPKEQFWFLGWIALMMILAAIVQPWKSRARAGGSFCAVLVISLLTWGTSWQVIGTQGLGLTVFFWTGLLLTGERVMRCIARSPLSMQLLVVMFTAALMMVVVATTSALGPTGTVDQRSWDHVVLGFIASVAGVISIVSFSAIVSRSTRLSDKLGYLGRSSLQIFVAHVFFAAVTRICLVKLGYEDWAGHLVFGLLSGIYGPVVLDGLSKILKINWIFEAPNWLLGKREMQIVANNN